jgi:D-3-phosphoglycerate dehydrogenase
MANITRIFGQREINILGQHLDTRGDVGYVITDVNKRYDKEVVEELKSVPGTIKFRLLY